MLLLVASPALADDEHPELAVLHSFPGIDLVETINDVQHGHGGPPAKVNHAFINFEVRDVRAHKIEVRSISIVFDHCRGAKKRKTDVQRRALQGLELSTWHGVDPIAKGKASVSTPAGKPAGYGVKVLFDGVATYSGCGFAIDLVVDRVRKQIELPLTITRLEPRGDPID